jgi:uncharacterized protein YeaO (DUF488 family)
MTKQIQVANDILEFPADMSDEQIQTAIQREYGAPQNQQPQTQQQAPMFNRSGEDYFINKTTAKYLPFVSDEKLRERMRAVSSDPRSQAAFTAATNPLNTSEGKYFNIKAGIAAMTAKIIGGNATKDIDIGELYKEARENQKQELAQARKQYPIQSALTGFASDIPLETAALAKMGLGGVSTLPKLAAGGFALGAAGSVGGSEKETFGEVAQDALTSGTIGAVAAPVLASAIPAATNMIGKGATGIKNLFTKKTGEQVAEQSISPETARQGLEQLKASPESQPTVALDIDSPEFQRLFKTAVSKYPQSKKIAADFVAGRKEQATKRIEDILSKDISSVKHAFDKIKDLDLTRKIAVKPVIAEAYKEGAEIPTLFEKGLVSTSKSKSSPDTIIPFSNNRDLITGEITPSLTRKGETTTSSSAREGRVPIDRSGLLGGGKPLNSKERGLANQYENLVSDPRFREYSQDFPNLKPNSVEMLHNIRKSVDKERSALEKNLSGISPTAAASRDLIGLNNFRAKITDLMYKATGSAEGKIGTMEKADKIYAGESKLMDAVKEGMNFRKLTQSEIVNKIKNYSPGERDAYRIGVRQDLQTNMNKATKIAGKSSPSEKIFNDLESQKRLRAVFLGDKKKYEEFAKRMGEEISYDKTIKNLGLNKQEVEAGKAGMINLLARVITFGATGAKPGLVFEGARAAETAMLKNYKGLNEKSAKELMKAFTNKQSSIRILQNIVDKADKTQKPVIREAIKDIYPAIIGGSFGANFGDTSLISEAEAKEPQMSEEQIRRQLIQQGQQYPMLSNGQPIDPQEINAEAQQIKQRYSK